MLCIVRHANKMLVTKNSLPMTSQELDVVYK